jgi:hypothetical protein
MVERSPSAAADNLCILISFTKTQKGDCRLATAQSPLWVLGLVKDVSITTRISQPSAEEGM